MIFKLFDPQTKGKIEVEANRAGNEWMALCPKHTDRSPSLSIDPEKKVFYCHGCGFKGGLWDDTKRRRSSPNNDKQPDDPPERSKEITTTYDYRNSRGDLLFQTLRLSAPPPKGKTFRQRRPDGNGGWIWNLNGVPLIPYRLPELLVGDDPVFICEGEKDVDNLRALGLTVTTSPMGAGKWRSIFNPYFGGRDVIILPDNDDPGKNHAKQVAKSLKDIAKSIKIAELPDLPEKGDVSDFLCRLTDATKQDFLELTSLLAEECKDKFSKDEYNFISGKELIIMKETEVKWFWDGVLPAGGLSLLLAKPKVGKTIFALNIAFRASRGEPFLGKNTTQGNVIYLAIEESRSEVQESLIAFEKTHGESVEDNLLFHFGITPTDAIQKLEKVMEEIKPKFVVIDILQKFLKLDRIEDYAEVISKFEPLMDIARRLDCHILLLHHAPKSERELIDSALGSTGLAASVDTIILEKKDAKERRSFSTAQRYRKPGEADIKDWVITLAKDEITLELAGTTSEVNTSDVKEQILRLLENIGEGKFYPGPMSESQIRDEIKRSKSQTLGYLKELYQERKVKREGTGHKNDSFKYSLNPREMWKRSKHPDTEPEY